MGRTALSVSWAAIVMVFLLFGDHAGLVGGRRTHRRPSVARTGEDKDPRETTIMREDA